MIVDGYKPKEVKPISVMSSAIVVDSKIVEL